MTTSKISGSLNKWAPLALSCIASLGTIVTAVATAKATIKAVDLVNKDKEHNGIEESTVNDNVIKTCWKLYIPPVLACASTIGCIFGVYGLGRKAQSSLLAAYGMLDNMFREYRNKVKSANGGTDLNIRGEIVKDKLDGLVSPSGNKCIFYEEHYAKYFERTKEEVLLAEYHFNRNFALRGCANLNEFYEFLGLPHIPGGDFIGWSFDVGQSIYGYSWIDFCHDVITTDDGLEVYLIDMPFSPTADYLDHDEIY